MDRATCIIDYPPDLRQRAEAVVQEDIPNLEHLSPDEIREVIRDLRINYAELEFKNQALQQTCEEQARREEETRASKDELEEQVWRRTVDLEKNITNLRKEIDGRKQAEEELTKHREHLEGLVQERTAQLEKEIDERKRAEEQAKQYAEHLRRQTAQLEAANKELESFSYSISHDLRAPLRTLDGFSTALLEDFSGKLDAEGQDYLNRIRAAAQRMARLIDDILQLSRTGRAELHYTTVNLSVQAQSFLEELRQAEPGRKAEMYIQESIIVEGDESLLRQVLQNLLGNAWKFTSHQEAARIEFGEKREDRRRIFYVRDNGAGFDMQYAGNLFIPFRRLHTEQEFPGTGIGLSIVKRIIERHGGTIWAESEPGKGATFYFTLGE